MYGFSRSLRFKKNLQCTVSSHFITTELASNLAQHTLSAGLFIFLSMKYNIFPDVNAIFKHTSVYSCKISFYTNSFNSRCKMTSKIRLILLLLYIISSIIICNGDKLAAVTHRKIAEPIYRRITTTRKCFPPTKIWPNLKNTDAKSSYLFLFYQNPPLRQLQIRILNYESATT